jgi:general stress protein 26
VKKTTDETDPQAAARLRELISDISVAMLTTVTPDGALHSRPMFTQDFRGAGELWFFVADDGESAHDLAEERAVNLSYADPLRDRYVSVTGMAEVVHDPELNQDLWSPSLSRYFPKGLEDPHLALLRVRIESAEYWDVPSRRMVPLEEQRADGADAGREHTHIDVRSVRASG